MALSLIAGLVFGLVPALQKPRELSVAARTSASVKQAFLRRSMVIFQIAISMVLLAGAALLVRSFGSLRSQSLGLQSRGILVAHITLNRYRYTTPQSQMQFFNQAEGGMRHIPGVSDLALSDSLPPDGYHHDQIFSNISVAGRPAATGGTGGMVTWRWVTPGYFKALNIPIVRGREFSEEQRTSKEPSVVISTLLASRLFPNQYPIGQHVQLVPNGPWYTVQGVAADVKNGGLNSGYRPEYYQLHRNLTDDWQQSPSQFLILKTTLAPKAIAPWVQSTIAQIDPTVPVDIETLNERVSQLADRPRFETALLGFFALTGLAMAVIGLYGVIAFMTIQRTQEIGLRMALGASQLDILRLVLWEGIRLVVMGGAIGLIAALALSRVLESVLFAVGPHDPVSFMTVTLLLALVALAATIIPARFAMKTDPMVALRAD